MRRVGSAGALQTCAGEDNNLSDSWACCKMADLCWVLLSVGVVGEVSRSTVGVPVIDVCARISGRDFARVQSYSCCPYYMGRRDVLAAWSAPDVYDTSSLFVLH